MKTVKGIILSLNIEILGMELGDFFGVLLGLLLTFFAIAIIIGIILVACMSKVGRILTGIGVGVWVWVCHGLGWGIVAGLLSVGLARAILSGKIGF